MDYIVPERWSKEEDKILLKYATKKTDKELSREFLPKRSRHAIHARRINLGIHKRRPFSKDEDKLLMELYPAYVSMNDLVKRFRRSKIIIYRRAQALGLQRDLRIAKLVSIHGTKVLENGDSYSQVLAAVRKLTTKDNNMGKLEGALKKACQELQKTFNNKKLGIDGRDKAIIKARSLGVELKTIVAITGLSRETIRRIALNVSGANLSNLARKLAALSIEDYNKVIELAANIKKEF